MTTTPSDSLSPSVQKRRSGRKITLLVLTFLLALSVWLVYRAIRQENLKHELIAAIKANDTPRALSLLNAGADANAHDTDPGEEHPSLLQEMLDRIFHPGKKHEVIRYPSALLIVVTMQGPKFNGLPEDPTLVKALLDHGAEVDYADKDRITPLLAAVSMACSKNARCLLEHGADPNQVDSFGTSSLGVADRESAELLLQHGADRNALNDSGQTPLLILCSLNIDESVQLLLQWGVDVNVRDKNGNTALLYASRKCRLDTVKMLLEHGADITAKDSRGGNALYRAAFVGRTDLVALYLEKGLNVNSRKNDGATPLMAAASGGHEDTLKLLISRGADVNARKTNGDTALVIARRQPKTQMAQLLKAARARETQASLTAQPPGMMPGMMH